MNNTDFNDERECIYKGEKYSSRDNGQVMRHAREGKRLRKLDNIWTFGVANKTGYVHIGSERIHRIVAFAFFGEPPTPQHVVDHIDTNRQNNLPDNLRWLTKLENILKNPITLKRVIFLCGSIEAFLADPSLLKYHKNEDPNFGWMRAVTPEEAKTSLERLSEWAKMENNKTSSSGALGEWVYQEPRNSPPAIATSEIVPSITPIVIQKNWGAHSEFPFCRKKVLINPISEYAEQIEENEILFHNAFYSTTVLKNEIADNGDSLLVLYETIKKEVNNQRWGIMKITFESGKYIHEIIPNYNGTLEHYWLVDVENHFKSIIENRDWIPLYDSQGRKFGEGYMPL